MTLPAWLRNGIRNPTTLGAVLPAALFGVSLVEFWVFAYHGRLLGCALALYSMVGLVCWGPPGSSQTGDD